MRVEIYGCYWNGKFLFNNINWFLLVPLIFTHIFLRYLYFLYWNLVIHYNKINEKKSSKSCNVIGSSKECNHTLEAKMDSYQNEIKWNTIPILINHIIIPINIFYINKASWGFLIILKYLPSDFLILLHPRSFCISTHTIRIGYFACTTICLVPRY